MHHRTMIGAAMVVADEEVGAVTVMEEEVVVAENVDEVSEKARLQSGSQLIRQCARG